jgi:hypothetical protein
MRAPDSLFTATLLSLYMQLDTSNYNTCLTTFSMA